MLEKKDCEYVSVSKEIHKQKLQLTKVFVTCKNFMLLSQKNPKMKIFGSQSSVPRDSNGLFWPAQKWLTLFAYEALIKNVVLLVNAIDRDLTYKDLIKLTYPKYLH